MKLQLPFCFLFAGSLSLAYSQPLLINTMAGHDLPGSADGLSSSARFNYPNSIAADSAGNIFVADTLNSTIRRIASDGTVSTFAGSVGNIGSADGVGTNAQFYAPQGIAIDSANFIYVADTGNATIRKISPQGMVSTFAGSAGVINSFDGAGTNANFFRPQSLTLDSSGNVFVADTGNHTIRKITSAGVVTTLAGLAGFPGCVDNTNSKARFNSPSGIACDLANNLFVSDFFNHTIRKISANGEVTTIAGLAGVWGNVDGTNSATRFNLPQGIAVSSSGEILVSDSCNHTIRKISSAGTNWIVTTVAGSSGMSGSRDGIGDAARFQFPAGIGFDSQGDFYVADFGNNAIRTERIIPPPLQFLVSGNDLIFSWPVSASGFVLESAESLQPNAEWIAQTNGVNVSGDFLSVTTNLDAASRFYRLRRE